MAKKPKGNTELEALEKMPAESLVHKARSLMFERDEAREKVKELLSKVEELSKSGNDYERKVHLVHEAAKYVMADKGGHDKIAVVFHGEGTRRWKVVGKRDDLWVDFAVHSTLDELVEYWVGQANEKLQYEERQTVDVRDRLKDLGA